MYASIEQRMAQGFLDLFPAFVPDEGAEIGIEAQRQFYDMMHELYRLAYDEPLLFVPALHEDDAYPHRYGRMEYNKIKPKMVVDMRKFTKAVNGLVEKMFRAGKGEAVELSRREVAILARLGVADLGEPPAAWRWMAAREDAHLLRFGYCLFDGKRAYTPDIYGRLLGAEAFGKLMDWMLQRGYEVWDVYNTTASDCKLSLSVANPKWSAAPPTGGYEYKVKHTGIAAIHDLHSLNPVSIGVRIPGNLGPFLRAFDEMGEGLQRFVIGRTKRCDGCRYCVQTDKTGARPLAFVPIEFEGEMHRMCTYYPGGSYWSTQLSDELAENMMAMLEFMDRFAPGN